MALFTWDTKYSVGLADIDEQHQRLFRLINDLHDAVQHGHGREMMTRVLQELVAYFKTHFAD